MKKILFVDDDPVIQKLLQDVFTREGYEVSGSSDGIKALEVIRKAHPDLIILDIMMPNMNGYDVCRIIKQDPDLKLIPIILLTSREMEVGMYLLKAMGIEYVHKMTRPEELLTIARKMIGA